MGQANSSPAGKFPGQSHVAIALEESSEIEASWKEPFKNRPGPAGSPSAPRLPHLAFRPNLFLNELSLCSGVANGPLGWTWAGARQGGCQTRQLTIASHAYGQARPTAYSQRVWRPLCRPR